MASRRTLSAVTLSVLLALLLVGAVVGWRALFAPLPEGEPVVDTGPECDPGVRRGEIVRTRDVTVSVYNAGSRAGLAGQTQQELATRGFIPGDVGNAPDELAEVRFVRVLAPSPNDPAARLVALQFGARTLIEGSDRDLGPGVEVVVGDGFLGLKEAPRQLRATAPGSGC